MIQSFPQGTITITPKNYQAHFAFWANTDPSNYSSVELEELNNYSVTLVESYDTQNLEWWKDNYSKVTFSIVVYCGSDQNTLSST